MLQAKSVSSLVYYRFRHVASGTHVLERVHGRKVTITIGAEVVRFLVMFFHITSRIQPLNSHGQLLVTSLKDNIYHLAIITPFMVLLVVFSKLRVIAKVFVTIGAEIMLGIRNPVVAKILVRPVIYTAIVTNIVFLRVAFVSVERVVRAERAVAAITIGH